MNRTFPRGWVVFCDDVRHEIGNKPSYMGVYHNFMFVSNAFPILLPKFVAAVTYIDSLAAPHGNVTIQLFLPGDSDDKPSSTVPIDVEEFIRKSNPQSATGRPATKLNFQFELQITPFLIKEPGFIKVLVAMADDTMELGRLEIASAVTANAPEITPDAVNPAPGLIPNG